MIRNPRERQMHDTIRDHAPLAGLDLTWQQTQILARACARVPALLVPVAASGPRPMLAVGDCQLIALLAEGLDQTQIAYRLGVTHGAVRNRVSRLIKQLDAGNSARLVALGYELGLLPIVDAPGAAR